MGELQTEYAGQANFTIVSAEETATRGDELETYGLTEMRHGLVVFGADGEAAVKMPGHQFGKDEIAAALKGVLGAE